MFPPSPSSSSPSPRKFLSLLILASSLLLTSLGKNITCYKCDWGECEGSTETCIAKAACYYAESGIGPSKGCFDWVGRHNLHCQYTDLRLGYKSCLCRKDLCNFAKPENDIVFNEGAKPNWVI